MERVASAGIELDRLQIQRRMDPQMSELIAPVYPDLQNHPSTMVYPPSRGLASPVFFLDHRWKEGKPAAYATLVF